MSGFFEKLFSSPKRQSTRKRKRSPSLRHSSQHSPQHSPQPLMIHSPLRLLLNTQMPVMRMPVMHNRPTLKRTGNYHSEQTHIEYVNGTQKERRQIVDINGKNGTNTVIVTRNGKKQKSTKSLSPKEIECIRKCQFMPGLFKSCDKCIR
jgi:hypothetical protein